ncbi:MAG: hypothetical protein Q9174_002105 [Haloplaca sp. 1 TL-2023]
MVLRRNGHHAYILLFLVVSSLPGLLGRTVMARNDTAHSLPLTFGIEIEYILGFHESLLRPFVPSSKHIVKSIPDDHRAAIRQVTRQYLDTRQQYHGWALKTPTDYPSAIGSEGYNECLLKYGYRAYADEILRMQSKILAHRRLEARIHDGKQKMQQFDQWHLTTDTSLLGATKEDLAILLKSNRITGSVDEWDSGPVELVSRVLRVEEEDSFTEIGRYLAALQPVPTYRHRRKTYTAFTSDFCGLHVHIGLPPPPPNSAPLSLSPSSSSASPTVIFSAVQSSSASSSTSHLPTGGSHTFPLPILQQLAYLTLVYEPIISLLHPPHRRPGFNLTNMDIASNRGSFEQPDLRDVNMDELEVEEDSDDDGDESDSSMTYVTMKVPRNTVHSSSSSAGPHSGRPPRPAWLEDWDDETDENLLWDLKFQHRVRTKIFDDAMTLQHLCGLMSEGQKGRVINWLYLSRTQGVATDGPRTIEFRQHEGTLDREEIRMWVLFCAGLMRWAEVMAKKFEEEVVKVHDGGDNVGQAGSSLQRGSGMQIPIQGPSAKPQRWRRDGEPDEGKRRRQEMEKWLMEAYGRGTLGIEDLIGYMDLKGELREWVVKRAAMWEDSRYCDTLGDFGV